MTALVQQLTVVSEFHRKRPIKKKKKGEMLAGSLQI